MNVLVLAAGKSTRIRSVSQGLPKPLMPLQGVSILERNLRWLKGEGIRSVWINLHFKPDEIKAAIGSGERLGLSVQYSFEPEILGTAGAYKNLEEEFHGPTLIVYGDNALSFDLRRFKETHERSRAIATVALFDQGVHAHTGIAGGRVVVDDNGTVLRFDEASDTSRSKLVNAGVYLLEPSVLTLIPKGKLWDFGKNVFPKMLETGQKLQAHVIEKEGYCLGLDKPESFEKGRELVETGRVKLH